jgi:hypothetical protein
VSTGIKYMEAFMKTNRNTWFFTGMGALLLSFALVLANCSSIFDPTLLLVPTITVTGEPVVGRTLTATVTGGSGDYTITWEMMPTAKATTGERGFSDNWTGKEYVITEENNNNHMRAFLRMANGKIVCSGFTAMITWSATDDGPVPTITVTGEPVVGQTLTATVTGGSGDYTVRWEMKLDANTAAEIRGFSDRWRGNEYVITKENNNYYMRAYICMPSGKIVCSDFTDMITRPVPEDTPESEDGTDDGDNPESGGGTDDGDNPESEDGTGDGNNPGPGGDTDDDPVGPIS